MLSVVFYLPITFSFIFLFFFVKRKGSGRPNQAVLYIWQGKEYPMKRREGTPAAAKSRPLIFILPYYAVVNAAPSLQTTRHLRFEPLSIADRII